MATYAGYVARRRTAAIAAIRARAAEIETLTGEIRQLTSRLRTVRTDAVRELARLVPELPADGRRSFAGLRGRLPWPVPVRVAAGAPPRWIGILIETARGAKIRAPSPGRVVYADWLQGLGLLLIIAHDGNFMTLYGHAEVLYKSVGEEVAADEVLGAFRDSAGPPPQLYFEIREGRSPQDPRSWLQPVR